MEVFEKFQAFKLVKNVHLLLEQPILNRTNMNAVRDIGSPREEAWSKI